VLKDIKTESRSASGGMPAETVTNIVRNAIDVMRVLSLPECIEMENFLVGPRCKHGDKAMRDSDSEDSEDDDGHEENNSANDMPTATTMLAGTKRKDVPAGRVPKPKKKKLTRTEQLTDLPSYVKAFSKAWLCLLSMPLTLAQHKQVLKHLPDHVIPYLNKPLLLADYLTRSYEQRGVVSVLALDSLFQLIVKYNIDYPNFWVSLYRLCTVEVFAAKYRSKFMNLLALCLSSSNLPAYLVAAFVKRLAGLALQVPSPAALFCIAEVTMLLRKHPSCMVLVHRGKVKASTLPLPESGTSEGGAFVDSYNRLEESNLEHAKALNSSLWEMQALQRHHLHSVATMATALESSESTLTGVDAPHLRVQDFVDVNYESLIEEELGRAKKHSVLAFKQPSTAISPTSCVQLCFGK